MGDKGDLCHLRGSPLSYGLCATITCHLYVRHYRLILTCIVVQLSRALLGIQESYTDDMLLCDMLLMRIKSHMNICILIISRH
jgi:hypothetical protein